MHFALSKTAAVLCWGLLLFALASGCTSATTMSTPTASPISQVIEINPALAPLREAVSTCAPTSDEQVVVISTRPIAQVDTILRITYADQNTGEAFQIAWDQLVFASGDPELASEIKDTDLRQLFADPSTPFPGGEAFDVWFYPQGHPLRDPVINALNLERVSPNLRIAPDVEEMANALSQENSGLGVLPEAWLANDGSLVEHNAAENPELRIPIIAEVRIDSDFSRQVIACLQSDAGQQYISENYLPIMPIQ